MQPAFITNPLPVLVGGGPRSPPTPRRTSRRLRVPPHRHAHRYRPPTCTDDPPAPPPPSSLPPPMPPLNEIRDLALVALPMTSGNDVLFPGCSQLVTLDDDTAQRLLRDVADKEPPEFAYMTVNAWGDPGTVGTVAIIHDIQYYPAQKSADLLCTGVNRFNVVHCDEDLTQARVETFHDEPPTEEELAEIVSLEDRLIAAMTDIVTLSIKISDEADEARQRALNETLRRVEAFCGKLDGRELLQHWILTLSPELRRELLSFIVIDLLSISFMDRRSLMLSQNTGNRLAEALKGLDPYIKELAAKGAIVNALGRDDPPPESESQS